MPGTAWGDSPSVTLQKLNISENTAIIHEGDKNPLTKDVSDISSYEIASYSLGNVSGLRLFLVFSPSGLIGADLRGDIAKQSQIIAALSKNFGKQNKDVTDGVYWGAIKGQGEGVTIIVNNEMSVLLYAQ